MVKFCHSCWYFSTDVWCFYSVLTFSIHHSLKFLRIVYKLVKQSFENLIFLVVFQPVLKTKLFTLVKTNRWTFPSWLIISHISIKEKHWPFLCTFPGFSCSITTTSPAFSRKFTAELKAPPSRPDRVLEEVIHPAQQLVVTQIQPPILPPPPHPNFLSGDLNPKRPLEKDQHLTSTSRPVGSTPAATSQGFSPTSTSTHQFLQSKENNESPVNLKDKLMWSETPVPTQISVSQIKMKPSDSVKVTSGGESYHLKPSSFHQRNILSKKETTSQISPNKPTALHFSASPQQTTHRPATPMSFLPKFHLESPDMQLPPSLITKPPPLQFDDRPTAATLNPGPSQQHHPVSDPVNTSHVYWLNQANSTQKDQPSNSTELTDWKRRNTSQSPMTSNHPMWVK